MTPNQQREEISKAYIAAIAARCGYKLGTWSQDDDCLDVTIGVAGVLGGGTLAGPKIDLQLKCSSDQRHVHDQHIAWSLERAHYDRLRHDCHTPILLVVLMLPADEHEWISYSNEELIMRRCAYWEHLHGRLPLVGDAATTTIHIPRTNLFCPDSLRSMMTRISRGDAL
ncbi:DUF4365 domain-containing protein [Enhygromyxa salina]|uniref:DUF4365 domain-containing protein n=1 Tax=Enhygromyxa salina TaxID=215803 RepID=A0A2S9YXH2_9BACT|nr:DUF4365 domain-containing protein [Enhygromyxa salina]PRQ09795.1 hypothetical protein ENSA7_05500 [Enhygromyxa salina]